MFDHYTEVTRSRDPDEQWDGDDTYTEWTFKGLTRKSNADCFDIPKEWIGCNVFVVYVIWSTGDSFSHSSHAYAEGVGIYATHEEAEDVKKLIWDEYNEGDKDYSNNFVMLPSGQKLSTSAWKGYFESLNDVVIEEATVPKYVGE